MRIRIIAGLVISALSITAVVVAQRRAENRDGDAPRATGDARRATTEKADAGPATAPPKLSADEEAIFAAVEAFAKAFNDHDAKRIAALFTADAEIVSESGEVHQGRAAIEEVFAAAFEENPQGKTAVSVDSVRLLSPTVAVEDGTTMVTHSPDEPAERSKYTVVHIKQDGKWLMASARDLPDELAAGDEQLKQLSWLIGDWIDESPGVVVSTSYRWTDNHRFILGEFNVKIGGKPAMNGTNRIGWDAAAKTIRSWAFDTEGGFTESRWTRDGDAWIIKATGVTRDGLSSSATNELTYVTQDRATYRSRDRIAGGEVMDELDVILVRKPPPPK